MKATRKNYRLYQTLPLGVCITALLAGCERTSDPAQVARARRIMGTFATLTAVAPDKATAVAAVEAGYARLEEVNQLMSDYAPDSEIGGLNQLPAGQRLKVSPETFFCLQRADEVRQSSGGAFDITCRPLIQLWKRAARRNRLPSTQELEATRTLVGPDKLVLDRDTRTVSRTIEGVEVDLGGVAKGYSLDLAAVAMRRAGATGVLVDVGGDVLASGTKRDGKPWQIGVKHPFTNGCILKLRLSERAVATSGLQQRFYSIGGKRYSHIVDPRSGPPTEQAPCVTVIADDGLTADAWATAFSVLTIKEGQQLIAAGRTPPVEVMWISGPAENPTIEKTPGFDEYLVE